MGFVHSLGSKVVSAGTFIGKKAHEGLKYGVKHSGKIAEIAGKVSHVAGQVGDFAAAAAPIVAATGFEPGAAALAGVAAASPLLRAPLQTH